MKFKELVDKFNDKELVDKVVELYPDSNPDAYYYMLSKLRDIEQTKSNMFIEVYYYEPTQEFIEKFDDEPYHSVHGLEKDNITSWGLEYSHWGEWLAMEIHEKTIINYTEIDIVGHCLWEMTFHGYDTETVQEQLDEINDRVEKIKNGEVELIPWEEIKERLRKSIENEEE